MILIAILWQYVGHDFMRKYYNMVEAIIIIRSRSLSLNNLCNLKPLIAKDELPLISLNRLDKNYAHRGRNEHTVYSYYLDRASFFWCGQEIVHVQILTEG
jgi:hypothetical protein